jgi:hypothetical protein
MDLEELAKNDAVIGEYIFEGVSTYSTSTIELLASALR